MSVIYGAATEAYLIDPCEKVYEEAAIDALMAEFDRILTPVEKYVFCRKTGIQNDFEDDCRMIHQEIVDLFQITYKSPSCIHLQYRSAIKKLRLSYTEEDIRRHFS